MARGLKFRIKKVGGLYDLNSEDKGADQLRGCREADLRLCFAYAKSRFSHDAAHIKGSGHMTKMPTIPIYDKNFKSLFLQNL